MRECVEEGILQSYFDGELSNEMMESVASHLASCLVCTQAARELESESALLSQALEAEFAMGVPTERLRHRIDAAISGLSVVRPARADVASSAGATPAFPVVRRWVQSAVDLFTLSPQRAFGYAGLAAVILLVAIIGVIRFRYFSVNSAHEIVSNTPSPAPTASHELLRDYGSPNPSPSIDSGNGNTHAVYHPKRPSQRHVRPNEEQLVKLLPGERSYLKTIAALDSNIKAETDTVPMRPALQVEYERNLAIVDRAIAATRSAAKKNPNDPDAAEFMFAAYQSKVDLLNQVADARLSNKQH
jgi:hypothetical protein